MKNPMSDYRSVVTDINEIPEKDLRKLFMELLNRLDLCIIQEATPDYCAFELTKKGPTS